MRKLALGLAMLFCGAAVSAQTLESKVDAIVGDAMKQGPITGVSVSVRQHGRVLLEKGYGKASLELDVPVTPETRFHLDSITKHFTAAAVLHLVAQGKLSLDDKITKYIEGAPPAWKDITLRQLLSHSSGIGNFTDSADWTEETERLDHTHKDMLALIAKQPMDFPPGTSWKYSNSGLYLVGMVIEKVTGRPWGDYMRDEFFAPLGLKAVDCLSQPVIPNRAAGYEVEKGQFVNAPWYSWTAPFSAGALCGRASDVAEFERALVEGKLFPAALLDEMREPTRFAAGGAVDYGLATRRGVLEGHRVIGHTGSGGGFNNAFEYFPDDDLIVVVLRNTQVRPAATTLAAQIARAALGVTEANPLDLPVPAELRAAFAGTFVTSEAEVENRVVGERIRAYPRGGPPDGLPMLYQGDGWFVADDEIKVHFDMAGATPEVNVYYGGLCGDYGRKKK